MLTSQVFAIMSGTATPDQIRKICQSADKYLYDEKAGGYRLNTDFGEEKMDLGRMFGFAYGEKENGAVFSHMAVMYANALYRRGFAQEGNKALQALLNLSLIHISMRSSTSGFRGLLWQRILIQPGRNTWMHTMPAVHRF